MNAKGNLKARTYSRLFCAFRKRTLGKRAFSLVEIVLSLGVFSFAALSIVGLLGTGLSTVKNSSTNQAITNINRNLRASLQATSYANLAVNVSGTYYFTDGGYPTTVSSVAPTAPFYKVVVLSAKSQYPAGASSSITTSANAHSLLAAIYYPFPANTQVLTNSYFIAQ